MLLYDTIVQWPTTPVNFSRSGEVESAAFAARTTDLNVQDKKNVLKAANTGSNQGGGDANQRIQDATTYRESDNYNSNQLRGNYARLL